MAWKFLKASGSPKADTTPVGAMLDFAGSAAPTGWIICDGSAISQTTYASLYAVIGATYNTGGEPGGTFRVPDFRGRVSVAPDGGAGRVTSNNTLAASSGSQTQSLSTSQIPAHSHAAGTGAGNLKVGVHGHGHSLTLPSHTHSVGSYQIPNHSHGGAGLSVNIGADNAFSATQAGSGVNRANATHTHSASVTGNTGNLVQQAILGNSGGPDSFPGVGGSVSNSAGTEAVTGSTATALTQDGADPTHPNMQPYLVANKIIKY